VNYNYRRNILHDRIYWWDIGSKFIEWRFSFQCDIAISIRNLARSQRCGKLSRVLCEAIVTRYASTFAFNCVCKRILGQVSSTRHFDGRTSDVKDISHMYDVTFCLVCARKKPWRQGGKGRSIIFDLRFIGRSIFSPASFDESKFSLQIVMHVYSCIQIRILQKGTNYPIFVSAGIICAVQFVN